MSSVNFAKSELAAALARGVRQCVVIGWPARLRDVFKMRDAAELCPDESLRVFALNEDPFEDSTATFVPTQFTGETLATALAKSEFDKLKASLFVWLGGAGYRTMDAAIASLSFIASLPKGSGVILDYAVERTSAGSLTHTALDALASRLWMAGDSVKYLIQPQAVTAMLRGLGFQQILDLAQEELPTEGARLVSAVV
jgi:O-methyltransferase involved in polyketide biosynthesis